MKTTTKPRIVLLTFPLFHLRLMVLSPFKNPLQNLINAYIQLLNIYIMAYIITHLGLTI